MSALWDVAVIGAGPCGALAARQLARTGCSVLLLDKAGFPREKVCGGCVSAAGLEVLAACGLADLGSAWPAGRLHAVELVAGGHRATLPLAGGVAVARGEFDAALARAAVRAGAEFRPRTRVYVQRAGPRRVELELHAPHGCSTAVARVVIVADGLAGQALRHRPDLAARIEPGSRLGGHALLAGATDPPAGTIRMVVGKTGYVGLVRLADGRLNVAAAIDRPAVRAGLGPAADVIVRAAGVSVPGGLARAAWRGVPALTRRRRRCASGRLLVAGDAAGYVEPFTGEGITWALVAGAAAAEHAGALLHGARADSEWDARLSRLLGSPRRRCRVLTRLLRHESVARGAVAVLRWAPALARPLLAVLARGPLGSAGQLQQDHLDHQPRPEGERDAASRRPPGEEFPEDEKDGRRGHVAIAP